MKKVLLGIVVLLLVVIGFMISGMVQQHKSYQKGLNGLEQHYEEKKYDTPISVYLDNHFPHKKEFVFTKPVSFDYPLGLRSNTCFEHGLSEGLIVGTWAKDDPPFCVSEFSFNCVVEGRLPIEGIADEEVNDCMNEVIVSCSCWY